MCSLLDKILLSLRLLVLLLLMAVTKDGVSLDLLMVIMQYSRLKMLSELKDLRIIRVLLPIAATYTFLQRSILHRVMTATPTTILFMKKVASA